MHPWRRCKERRRGTKAEGHVASVMNEVRVFPPPAEFSAKARIGSLDEYRRLYDAAMNDPDGFWDERAKAMPWITPYTKVLDWAPPDAHWFVGGRINASAVCLDAHIAAGRGDERLKKLGIKPGEVVSIYMPMTPSWRSRCSPAPGSGPSTR
jgi:acetyl-CoA synthetase